MPGVFTEFYQELESLLPTSTGESRKKWVTIIIENNIPIKDLSELLQGEQKVATRFLWMMSELGMIDPHRLHRELPFLLEVCNDLKPLYKTSFANFWLIAGVPEENEGQAIDILFQWLLSADTNVTIKSRALLVLFKLTYKYPELKNELKLCLEDQVDKYSNEFRKRATKVLMKLEG